MQNPVGFQYRLPVDVCTTLNPVDLRFRSQRRTNFVPNINARISAFWSAENVSSGSKRVPTLLSLTLKLPICFRTWPRSTLRCGLFRRLPGAPAPSGADCVKVPPRAGFPEYPRRLVRRFPSTVSAPATAAGPSPQVLPGCGHPGSEGTPTSYPVPSRPGVHDVPARDRQCRHVIAGEFSYRECPHAFDCRQCETHAKLIANRALTQAPEPEEDIFGMAFPLDRVYHRGHTWLRGEPDGTVTVGLDDLGRRLLGEPDRVDLPHPGDRVSVNGTAWHARKRNADVRVLSPVDGEIVATGGPDAPWYLKIRPDRIDVRHLLGGHEIRPWVMREMERLQLALSAEGAVPTLADGGVPVPDIAAVYPEANWDAVCGEVFLH